MSTVRMFTPSSAISAGASAQGVTPLKTGPASCACRRSVAANAAPRFKPSFPPHRASRPGSHPGRFRQFGFCSREHLTAPSSLSTGLSAATGSDAATTGHRARYLLILGWAFAAFNAVRIFAYLPTLWAIHVSGDSSQHSLWTWITWLGANTTMAAWLYENNAHHVNTAVLVNACNACMCMAVTTVILAHRYL